MNEQAYLIRERFPDEGDSIAILATMDPEFRAMCEDYDDCIEALRYWDWSQAPEAVSRADEYRNLVQELEKEIIQALSLVQS